jgi:hypothetical protein
MRMLSSIVTAAVLAVPALGAPALGAPIYNVGIVSPTDQQTVFSDSGDFSVQTTVVPDLAKGDRLEFLVDGTPVAPPSAILEFPLYGIPRGEHVLQARIIDSTGNVASTSPASIVYVWQASLLFPNRRAPQSMAVPSGPTSVTHRAFH